MIFKAASPILIGVGINPPEANTCQSTIANKMFTMTSIENVLSLMLVNGVNKLFKKPIF